MRYERWRIALALLFGWLCVVGNGSVAEAQSYAQTARTFIPSPLSLGMGGAGAAFPTQETAFFYNPAHLARSASPSPRIHILGMRGQASTNVLEQWRFYRDELRPALRTGIADLSEARQDELYDEARHLSRQRSVLAGDLLLPSFTMRLGEVGLGAGLYAHSLARYRVDNAGADVPHFSGIAHLDLLAVGSASVHLGSLGAPGLYAGLTLKHARRYLTLKDKPLDAFEREENAYLLEAASTGVDAGLLYELPISLPGSLLAGLSLFDVFSTGFTYDFSRSLRSEGAVDAQAIQTETALANERLNLQPSYRIGFSYLFRGSPERPSGVAIDYVGYDEPLIEQSFLTHLHLGLQVYLHQKLALRAGLHQGYPSLGAGLQFGPLSLDYAFYGVEDGRMAGQLPRWNHSAQLAIRVN